MTTDGGPTRFLNESERRLTNYRHIFEVLLEEAGCTRRELGGLIATLGAYIREEAKPPVDDSTLQRLETERRSVQVMTMHKRMGRTKGVNSF